MREKSSTFGRLPLGLALLLCGLSLARGGYLFTEEPLVRVSPAVGDSDLFGYAVALHRVDDTGATNDFYHAINNTKILVGAPSGTYPGGLPVPPDVNVSGVVNRTGLVYACPITPGDCDSVSGNGVGNDVRMFDYEANELFVNVIEHNFTRPNEEKDEQFMGATIVSTGEHVVICAPRWRSLEVSEYGPFDKTRSHGRCFYSGRNLMDFKLLRPCTSGNSQESGGESYCMAGTAATVYESGSSSNFSVFLGGPPYDESSGIIFQYDLSENETPSNFKYIPMEETLKEFLYSGTSVTVGRVFNSDERDLVYSIPKNSNYRGGVAVYSLSSRSVQAEVAGKQMGEYFGWVVATADLNGDNYDEVIVGAPLFSTPDVIEKGRIFIYKNNGTGTLDTDNPIVITGTVNKGRFGSAIVNLGDINSDGFEDIAVSAPFEKQEDEAEGTVYIYLGSGETYINEKPEETIRARDISNTVGLKSKNSLQSFGYSLSSGVDVDANLYNDLVIGGYKQQTVVVLRTRSIANVTLSLSTNPEELLEYNILNCNVGDEMFACFNLSVSASFSGRGLDNRTLETIFTVTEEKVSSGEQRLFFLDLQGNRVDTFFTGNLKFNTTDETVQKTIKIYVENGILERRANLSVVVKISERQQRSTDRSQDIIDLRDIPILTVLPRNVELSLSGCGEDMICEPDLELTLNETRYLNAGEMRISSDDILAGEVGFIEVVLDYQTLTEDAINTSLAIALPSSLLKPPESIVSSVGKLATSQCSAGQEDMHTCELEPIFSVFEKIRQVVIRFPVQDVRGDESDDTVSFTIANKQNDTNTDNNVVNVNLAVSARASVTFSELYVIPNVTQYEDSGDFGQRISARATVSNSGPSTIPNAKLTIYLPGKTERTGDFYYLYPVTSSVTCSGLNPDNIDDFRGRRRRRSTTPSNEHEQNRIRKRAITETVNCAVDRDSCIAIVCNITNLKRDVTVTINSNVDNRFFRSQKGDFEFHVYAEFRILNDFIEANDQKTTSNKFLVQETKQAEDKPIPVWVYIVSAFGAIIVLAVIILLLYMVGFFRLRRREKITEERDSYRRIAGATTSTAVPADTALNSEPEENEKLDENPPTDPPSAEGTEKPDEKPDEKSDETQF